MEVFTQELPERPSFAFTNTLEVTFSGDKAYQLLTCFG
ncbi:exodeoxyribonuclease V alpha subunit domain protein [Vibrio parahaemolyticus 605]|nr:exodeoxyribonuclease V alpha subunit domain protein [Vibrio parahaemolyticus B-265]ETT08193.1 exodeoxyribonuclease V alpha subunit domain protein [Vibrio parahaemolyticus 605]ETX68170.1 exodeoxyribonuclease V alpha subunit domain protein [Vibrio parahaemolyticus Peru-288]EUC23627.1 exodeoxyribonuclease V alpha subunit domain protein [Vibrio parahaemolyticus 861]EUD14197.1 exodeoxyribonuclease V alpha subunit domain protein [Vibrio parahaemolyticus EKP-026]EVU12245.1 exodeoxyribonuclease V a